MAGSLRQARKAVTRGSQSEALVLLWNELEPARLAGDESALATIAELAARIEQVGDESERRDAARLRETLETRAVEEGGRARPATAVLDADVRVPEGFDAGEAAAQRPSDGEATPDELERGSNVGAIIGLVLFLLIVLLNVIGRLLEG